MSSVSTRSDAQVLDDLRRREQERIRIQNAIIRARRQGASPDQVAALAAQQRENTAAGRSVSLENTARRRQRQQQAEFAPRDIPDDEIRQQAEVARVRGRTAERLAAEQGQQVQRQDRAAVEDVSLNAEARRRGITPDQLRELRRLATPVTPESLSAQSDEATATDINRQGGASPQAVLGADLGDNLPAGEARIRALRSQLASQPQAELSGRPTDPELARQFDAGREVFQQGEARVSGEANQIALARVREQEARERERQQALEAAQLAEIRARERAAASVAPEFPNQAGGAAEDQSVQGRVRQVERRQQERTLSIAEAAQSMGFDPSELDQPGTPFNTEIDRVVKVLQTDAGIPALGGVTTVLREGVSDARSQVRRFVEQIGSLPPEQRQAMAQHIVGQLRAAGVTSESIRPLPASPGNELLSLSKRLLQQLEAWASGAISEGPPQ